MVLRKGPKHGYILFSRVSLNYQDLVKTRFTVNAIDIGKSPQNRSRAPAYMLEKIIIEKSNEVQPTPTITK